MYFLYGVVILKSEKYPRWVKKLFPDDLIWVPCADHVYWENDMLISEPYDCSMSEIKKLILFCDANCLEFHMSGKADHNEFCLRIEIQPRV